MSGFPGYRAFRRIAEILQDWSGSRRQVRCPVIETATRMARESGGSWTGTATELLEMVRHWWPHARIPGSASALSAELRAAAPYLREAKGIVVAFRREGRERLIDITLI